ncbi:unnamed protein product [Gadus morhua 'NCC']
MVAFHYALRDSTRGRRRAGSPASIRVRSMGGAPPAPHLLPAAGSVCASAATAALCLPPAVSHHNRYLNNSTPGRRVGAPPVLRL